MIFYLVAFSTFYAGKMETVYIDKNVYLNFQIYALQNNRSVSSLIEE